MNMNENKPLYIKYTDDMYATKKDVMRALNTSLIDPFWKSITNYREQYKKVLSMVDSTKSPYFIIFTRAVQNKVTDLQTKLSNMMMRFASISEKAFERVTIRNEMLSRILKCVARFEKIDINDVAIANIINGHQTNLEYTILVNYYNALCYLESNIHSPANVDRLGDYYSIISGGELTSFYRTVELQNRNQSAIIGREYTSAPVKLIESMMNNALDFISESVLEYPVRAFASYFALNSIKPFESDNELVSMLLMKHVLGSNSVEKIAAILPFEELLLDEKKKLADGFTEAARQRDLTYLLIAFMDILDACLNTFTSRLETIQLTTAQKEFIQGDNEEDFYKEVKDYLPKGQTKSNIESEPVISKPQAVEKPVRRPSLKKDTQISQPSPKVIVTQQTNNKDYDSLAEDLLESDPLLRPAQAAFYVRHCTVGKYYTIQQFKKQTGCVYETARTSMDNLAKRGYYKRESLKNKFIYTPIAKE